MFGYARVLLLSLLVRASLQPVEACEGLRIIPWFASSRKVQEDEALELERELAEWGQPPSIAVFLKHTTSF